MDYIQVLLILVGLGLTVQEQALKRCIRDEIEVSPIPILFDVTDVTTSNETFCVMELRSRPRTHVTLTLRFLSRNRTASCSQEYIHVGNDVDRINVHSPTSYRLCSDNGNEEIVSRGSYLWVVFKLSDIPQRLVITTFSSKRARCKASEFECSPVQCVGGDRVCDGVTDCNNNRDEFCHTAPPSDDPCFRCGDGQCIRPELPRYSLDHGKELWYLCDEIKHCTDGTDERKDICFRIKGKANSVISCVPNDVTSGSMNPVLMWNNVVCNGERECLHGEDEPQDQCTKDVKEELDIDVGALSFIVVFTAVIVAVVAFTVRRNKMKRKKYTDQIEGLDSGACLNSAVWSLESTREDRVLLPHETHKERFTFSGFRVTTL